jgi:hypothetical protein
MDWHKRKHDGHSVPVHNKKPYYGDVRPGQEYHEPRLYQQPNYSYDDGGRKVSSNSSMSLDAIAPLSGQLRT